MCMELTKRMTIYYCSYNRLRTFRSVRKGWCKNPFQIGIIDLDIHTQKHTSLSVKTLFRC
jgi:hypothetical protein